MRFVIFTHSLVSDWNHGNAHFLRGIATELVERGHQLRIFEPEDGWSRSRLIEEHGHQPLQEFERIYPNIRSNLYSRPALNLDEVLGDADVVIVHEWSPPDLVAKIGEHRANKGRYKLFFHDTHHRSATDSDSIGRYDLTRYDGVLAYGRVIRDLYLERGWARRAWVWHEAADIRVFRPQTSITNRAALVWIGNWGDDERAEELQEFLIEPVKRLGIQATVYGVRYPGHALEQLSAAGIEYRGWLPNYRVPEIFSQHRVTVHVPRRPYVRALPGIPTIRPFEAMACGIPLVSAPWDDTDGLFRAGIDYLVVRDGFQMTAALEAVLTDTGLAQSLSEHGLETIRRRHTCAHRVDELLAIHEQLNDVAVSQGAI